MSLLPHDELYRVLAHAAVNACAVLAPHKGQDLLPWHDLKPEEQLLVIEAVKSVLGQPNTLTAESEIKVGDVTAFVGIVRLAIGTLGYTQVVAIPQPVFVPAAAPEDNPGQGSSPEAGQPAAPEPEPLAAPPEAVASTEPPATPEPTQQDNDNAGTDQF